MNNSDKKQSETIKVMVEAVLRKKKKKKAKKTTLFVEPISPGTGSFRGAVRAGGGGFKTPIRAGGGGMRAARSAQEIRHRSGGSRGR